MLNTIAKSLISYVVIALLCVVCFLAFKEVRKEREKAVTLESTISNLNQEIKYTKIRLNDSVQVYQAEVERLVMTQKNIQSLYDNLLKASKLKPKDVGNVTEVVTEIHKTDTVFAYRDTFGGLQATMMDPYLTIDVKIEPDLRAIFDYQIRDSLTIISVQKKHSWLFGLIKWTEQKSLRVINNNPNAEIVSLQTIDVIE